MILLVAADDRLAKIIVGTPEAMNMVVVVFIFYELLTVFKTIIVRLSFFPAVNIKEAECISTKSIHCRHFTGIGVAKIFGDQILQGMLLIIIEFAKINSLFGYNDFVFIHFTVDDL